MLARARVVAASLALLAAGACSKKSAPPVENGSAAVAPTGALKGVKVLLGGRAGAGAEPFAPSTEGFKFPNYGNEEGIENLTAAELERMFGDQVCADREGTTCLLTPPAQRWMEQTNKAMDSGHCEGLATMALLFQLGKLKASDFGAPTAFELAITDNKKLQHEVALWWSTQTIAPMSSAEIRTLTPNDVVDTLATAFQSGTESYTIGIYMPDGSGGHATTPYGIVDKGDGKAWILHYDNNFPGEERHIEVDRAANTWAYFTAADPKEPGSAYTGDATTKSLTLAPTSVRTGKLLCPFCGNVDADGADAGGDKGAMRQISLEGGADLLITDDAGKRIGHVDGKLVNEIAGAKIVEMKGEARRSEHEPIYDVPVGHPLTVTLDGSTLKGKESTDVTLLAAGYTLGVYGVALSPGEKDTIHFSSDWREISYQTDDDETPEIELGVETTGADYELDIHAAGETGGQRVDVGLDVKDGVLTVQASAKDGTATYEVEIHRIDKRGEQVFKHNGVAVGAADKFVFHYADWKGNGTPMKAGVDKGGDGSIDETEDLGDED